MRTAGRGDPGQRGGGVPGGGAGGQQAPGGAGVRGAAARRHHSGADIMYHVLTMIEDNLINSSVLA